VPAPAFLVPLLSPPLTLGSASVQPVPELAPAMGHRIPRLLAALFRAVALATLGLEEATNSSDPVPLGPSSIAGNIVVIAMPLQTALAARSPNGNCQWLLLHLVKSRRSRSWIAPSLLFGLPCLASCGRRSRCGGGGFQLSRRRPGSSAVRRWTIRYFNTFLFSRTRCSSVSSALPIHTPLGSSVAELCPSLTHLQSTSRQGSTPTQSPQTQCFFV